MKKFGRILSIVVGLLAVTAAEASTLIPLNAPALTLAYTLKRDCSPLGFTTLLGAVKSGAEWPGAFLSLRVTGK